MNESPLDSLSEAQANHARWVLPYLAAGKPLPASEFEQRLSMDALVAIESTKEALVELAGSIEKMGPATLLRAKGLNPVYGLLELESKAGAPWHVFFQVEDESPYCLSALHVLEGKSTFGGGGGPIELSDWDDLPKVLADHCGGAVQVSLIENGEVSWTRACGQAETGSPAAAKTLFQSGSISKPVAAFTIVRMAAAGLLDLDEDVNRYLKSWKVPTVGSWQPRITLRMLLRHFAGTTVHGFGGYAEGESVPCAADVLAGKGNSPKVFVAGLPGLGFRYSGGGTTIAQLAASEAVGRRFENLAEEFTLKPLGMTSSTFEQPLPEKWHKRAASAHEHKKPIAGRWNTYPELAAAGLWTTTQDLAKFGIGVAAALQGAPDALLPVKLARDMVQSPDGYPVGMGFFANGKHSFGHGGANRAFFGTLNMASDGQTGVAALTNAAGGNDLLDPIAALASRDTETDLTSPSAVAMMKVQEPPAKPISPLESEQLEGNWQLPFGPLIKIEKKADRCELTAPGQAPIELNQLDEETWQPEGLVSRIRVEASEAGDVLVISQLGARFRAVRTK